MYGHTVPRPITGGWMGVTGLLFSVGKVRVSKEILECDGIDASDLVQAFSRYLKGDWGDATPEQGLQNDVALATGERAVGVYHAKDGAEFWIEKSAEGTRVRLPVRHCSFEASASHR